MTGEKNCPRFFTLVSLVIGATLLLPDRCYCCRLPPVSGAPPLTATGQPRGIQEKRGQDGNGRPIGEPLFARSRRARRSPATKQ